MAIRVANSGISGIINGKGQIIMKSKLNTEAILDIEF
jgi:apolipoprotein N-acyltransferase